MRTYSSSAKPIDFLFPNSLVPCMHCEREFITAHAVRIHMSKVRIIKDEKVPLKEKGECKFLPMRLVSELRVSETEVCYRCGNLKADHFE